MAAIRIQLDCNIDAAPDERPYACRNAPGAVSARVCLVDGVVIGIGVQIRPARISYRVGLEEAPPGRGIGPGAIVVEA
jgi:hypothetical protein